MCMRRWCRSTQALTWLILPFFQYYADAGDFTVKNKYVEVNDVGVGVALWLCERHRRAAVANAAGTPRGARAQWAGLLTGGLLMDGPHPGGSHVATKGFLNARDSCTCDHTQVHHQFEGERNPVRLRGSCGRRG